MKAAGAKLREERRVKSGGGDDGHLRATAAQDTHLRDFFFFNFSSARENTPARLTDHGGRRSLCHLAAVEHQVEMRCRGSARFASAVGLLVLGLLCAAEAAKGN